MPKYQAILVIYLLRLLAKLPLSWVRYIGALVGRLQWLANGRARSTSEINITLCFPQLSAAEQRELAKRSLMHTAMLACEMGAAWLWDAETALERFKAIRNEDLMTSACERKQGVVILAPHIGNWEWVGLYLAKHYQCVSLYQPPKSPLLDQLIYKARTRNGSELVPTNRKGVTQLLKTLKAGKVIAILPDQEPDRESGVFAPFFGTPALTMTLLSNLVAKTGAKVVCCYARRDLATQGFELVFMPVEDELYSDDLQTSVAALNRAVEQLVLDAPEQYQWEYKRFKKRPLSAANEPEPRLYPKGK